jgi:hypothetical protein
VRHPADDFAEDRSLGGGIEATASDQHLPVRQPRGGMPRGSRKRGASQLPRASCEVVPFFGGGNRQQTVIPPTTSAPPPGSEVSVWPVR